MRSIEGPIRRPHRGSEWEPIKNSSRTSNLAYVPNSRPRIPTRVCQGRIVTMDLSTLRTNPKQSQSESETQEAKDLATLRNTRQTVRDLWGEHPHGLGGSSVGLRRTDTLNNGPSVEKPWTVSENGTPRGLSVDLTRAVRKTPYHRKLLLTPKFGTWRFWFVGPTWWKKSVREK
jgi:hypothetical protein